MTNLTINTLASSNYPTEGESPPTESHHLLKRQNSKEFNDLRDTHKRTFDGKSKAVEDIIIDYLMPVNPEDPKLDDIIGLMVVRDWKMIKENAKREEHDHIIARMQRIYLIKINNLINNSCLDNKGPFINDDTLLRSGDVHFREHLIKFCTAKFEACFDESVKNYLREKVLVPQRLIHLLSNSETHASLLSDVLTLQCVKVNETNKWGHTPLHIAASKLNLEGVRLLVLSNANLLLKLGNATVLEIARAQSTKSDNDGEVGKDASLAELKKKQDICELLETEQKMQEEDRARHSIIFRFKEVVQKVMKKGNGSPEHSPKSRRAA